MRDEGGKGGERMVGSWKEEARDIVRGEEE